MVVNDTELLSSPSSHNCYKAPCRHTIREEIEYSSAIISISFDPMWLLLNKGSTAAKALD